MNLLRLNWPIPILSLILCRVQAACSAQTLTCQEHGTAVLPFLFPFISGPEDLHVSLIKMESIDGDAEPAVICTLFKGDLEYQADQYRNRTEIRADLSSGKLELILKNVETWDAGIYKCQATNRNSFGDLEIKLCVKRSVSVKLTEIMKAEGESVTFQVDFSGPSTEVIWKIGEDKLVEVDDHGPYYYRLADRASASFHSGSLTIMELVESDSGYYSGNILTEGKYHETKFNLKVSPSKPEAHYNVTNGTITVYCESNSTGVTYEWRDCSRDLLSTEAVYTAPPETLRINDTITCIVRNKVTECSSSVTIEDYTLKDGAKPNMQRRNRIILLVTGFMLLAVSLVFLIFHFYKICCFVPPPPASRDSQGVLPGSKAPRSHCGGQRWSAGGDEYTYSPSVAQGYRSQYQSLTLSHTQEYRQGG